MIIHHLNTGRLDAPPNPPASCHCLLIENDAQFVLIDTGIGLEDIRQPFERIGEEAISAAGFQFEPQLTAFHQIQQLGYSPTAVTDIILTHGDPDHLGGIADFPWAQVHLSHEEHQAMHRTNPRYRPIQWSHQPNWILHHTSDERWFDLEARSLTFTRNLDVKLIFLPGHTLGHCGVAVHLGTHWLLHVGDAYYLRVELETDDHPVSALSTLRADNNTQRLDSLQHLRRLHTNHSRDIQLFSYHDFSEFPPTSSEPTCG